MSHQPGPPHPGLSSEAGGWRDLPSTSEVFTGYFSVLAWVSMHFSTSPYRFQLPTFTIYAANLKDSENNDHTYNQLTDTWIRQASKPQHFVTATILASDYKACGLMITKQTTPITLCAIADTGCQSCYARISAIHRISMSRKDLILATLQMHAANNAKIAIITTLSGGFLVTNWLAQCE